MTRFATGLLGAFALIFSSAAVATAAPPSMATASVRCLLPLSRLARSTPVLPLTVVAAENMYGDMARQIGGHYVHVVSILSDPATDPHTYESSVSDAIAVARASIVIQNGLGYDAWMAKLIAASPQASRSVLTAGSISGHALGDNPHLWYDLSAVSSISCAIATVLAQHDPQHTTTYLNNWQRFQTSLTSFSTTIATLHARYHGRAVVATERIYGYVLQAVGLRVIDEGFERAIENGIDPPPQQVAVVETALHAHQVSLLVYNTQTVDPLTQHMRALALANHIPVIGISETQPSGLTFQQWQRGELQALTRALAH